ncbi:MAG: hypothetical protein NUV46_01875 [Nanoarchaeota archaeon]|nr:hypothetical protein [Nanoarchaeota archaeon]
MKTFVLSLVVLFNLNLSFSQYKIDKVNLSFGDAALSPKLEVQLDLSNDIESTFMELKGSSTKFLFNYGKKVANFSCASTIGFLGGIPLVAGRIIYTWDFFTLTSWNGIGCCKKGTIEKAGIEPRFLFSFESVSLNISSFSVSCEILKFKKDEWNKFIGLKQKFEISEDMSLFGKIMWDFNNENTLFSAYFTKAL